MNKKIKQYLALGLIASIPLTLLSCASQTENEDNFGVNSSMNSADELLGEKDSTNNKSPVVIADLGAGEGDYPSLYYNKDGEKIVLATIFHPEGIYVYKDYFISTEVIDSNIVDEDTGCIENISQLILINKYTAEKKEFVIEGEDISGINYLNKETGTITVDTLSGALYSFDINTETFSKLNKEDISNELLPNKGQSNISNSTTDGKATIVEADEDTGSYRNVFYEDNGKLELIARIPVNTQLCEYKDYFVSLESLGVVELIDGEYVHTCNVFMVNKYTAEKEEFYIENEDIISIESFDKDNGKLTLKTLSEDLYVFDINSKTFAEK